MREGERDQTADGASFSSVQRNRVLKIAHTVLQISNTDTCCSDLSLELSCLNSSARPDQSVPLKTTVSVTATNKRGKIQQGGRVVVFLTEADQLMRNLFSESPELRFTE